jgi:HD-like signal output (HDOD) protein
MFGALKSLFRDPKKELTKVLGSAPIPSFPAVTLQTLQKLRDPNTPMKQVASLVETDPAVSVRVLKLVNSAAYGLRRPVNNVQHACTMLGRAKLEGIVLAVAVSDALPSGSTRGFVHKRFWKAAARRAATAKALADMLDPSSASVSFTAGLLQDLAVPMLAHNKKGYGAVLEQWNHDGGSLEDLERSEYGWDHAKVAGWLCADWSFPDDLGTSIAGHHGLHEAPAPVALVALLNEDGGGNDALIALAEERYSANADRVVLALERGFEQGQEVARLFV